MNTKSFLSSLYTLFLLFYFENLFDIFSFKCFRHFKMYGYALKHFRNVIEFI